MPVTRNAERDEVDVVDRDSGSVEIGGLWCKVWLPGIFRDCGIGFG